MSEYEFYGNQGFTQPELSSRQRAFFGGTPEANLSINDLKSAWYRNELGLSASENLSINDLEYRYYLSIGGDPSNSLFDLRQQYWSGDITPDEPSVYAMDETKRLELIGE